MMCEVQGLVLKVEVVLFLNMLLLPEEQIVTYIPRTLPFLTFVLLEVSILLL